MATGIRLGPGGEFDLIRRFLAGTGARPGPDIRVGPGHDCAVVAGDGIALSTDVSVEDVHFRRAWLDPEEIGYRAAAGALSDLAAVAARPIGVLLSVLLPDADVPAVAEAVVAGATAATRDVDGVVLGGDVARSPSMLALDVVAVGEAPTPVLRSGARPGDELWVSGRLGGAAAAVAAWRAGAEPDAAARAAFAHPTPRTREAAWLLRRVRPHAMIDLSDGLAGDAAHLAAASDVRVVLEGAAIPIHPSAALDRDASAALELALGGGEDYELCFAAEAGRVAPLVALFEAELGVGLSRVGRVEAGAGVWLAADALAEPRPLETGGYRHFDVLEEA